VKHLFRAAFLTCWSRLSMQSLALRENAAKLAESFGGSRAAARLSFGRKSWRISLRPDDSRFVLWHSAAKFRQISGRGRIPGIYLVLLPIINLAWALLTNRMNGSENPEVDS